MGDKVTTRQELQQSLFELTKEVIPNVQQMSDGNFSGRSDNTLCQVIIGNRREFTAVDFPTSMVVNTEWIFVSFLVFSEEKLREKEIQEFFEFCATHTGPISYWKLNRSGNGLELWLQFSIPAGASDSNLFLELLYENHILAENNSIALQQEKGFARPVDKFEYISKPARPITE